VPVVSGGAAGFGGPHVVLSFAAPIDIHAVADVALKWDVAYDDTTSYNVVTALPLGLGLSAAIDGSASAITATTAGVWAYSLSFNGAADAAITGTLTMGGPTLQTAEFGPIAPPSGVTQSVIGIAETLALPSGASFDATLSTKHIATANPYSVTPYLSLIRVA